jgi:uncharacterized NAD(P)/FAD-binding protein YdhS
VQIHLDELPRSIRGITRYLRCRCNDAMSKGDDWRAVINGLRPITQPLWQSLSLADKRRFVRHLGSFWRVHRTRAPSEVVDTFESLVAAGRITLRAGRIRTVREEPDGIVVLVEPRGRREAAWTRFDLLINCTGPAFDYSEPTPFVRRLLAKGDIAVHPCGIGLAVTPDGNVIDSTGGRQEGLFTLGAPCVGELLETTVVREIRDQADRLATRLTALPPAGAVN